MPRRRPSTPGRSPSSGSSTRSLGLLVAPLLFVLLVGGALISWYRHGRDPVYLDDPSIHIPAPPAGLTPAAGAVIRDGKSSRRALTTASLDLAVARPDRVRGGADRPASRRAPSSSIRTTQASTQDPVEMSRLERARARPMDEGTEFLLSRLRNIGGGTELIDPEELLTLGKDVTGFDTRLEKHVVQQGWFTEPPAKASGRWTARGIIAVIFGGDRRVRRDQPAVGRAHRSWPARSSRPGS